GVLPLDAPARTAARGLAGVHGGHASERPALAVSGAPLARGIPAQLLSRVRRARPGGDAAARSRVARRRYVAPHVSRGHAVNPDARLAQMAGQRGWRVERWRMAPGNWRLPMPDPRSPEYREAVRR